MKRNEKRLKFIQKQRKHNTLYRDQGLHPLSCLNDIGMGYEWDGKEWIEFPQVGSVDIGRDVRIGSYSSVKKGTLETDVTVIGDGCKIASYVNIGHNAKIGKHCLILPRASVGGSAIIGNNVVIGQGAIIKNKIKIGDGAIVGQGANVVKDVPPGVTVVGNPAKELL